MRPPGRPLSDRLPIRRVSGTRHRAYETARYRVAGRDGRFAVDERVTLKIHYVEMPGATALDIDSAKVHDCFLWAP